MYTRIKSRQLARFKKGLTSLRLHLLLLLVSKNHDWLLRKRPPCLFSRLSRFQSLAIVQGDFFLGVGGGGGRGYAVLVSSRSRLPVQTSEPATFLLLLLALRSSFRPGQGIHQTPLCYYYEQVTVNLMVLTRKMKLCISVLCLGHLFIAAHYYFSGCNVIPYF